MATYRAIASGETDPYAPIVASLMKALAANPIAIAEGASGAPRIMPLALQTYHQRVALATDAAAVSVLSLDPETVISVVGNFANGPGDTSSLQVSASSDGGSTWGAWFSLTGTTGATRHSVNAVINLKNGIVDLTAISAVDIGGNINALRFRHSAPLVAGEAGRMSVYAIGRAP